jgi:hypothetical protein
MIAQRAGLLGGLFPLVVTITFALAGCADTAPSSIDAPGREIGAVVAAACP